eukprot:Opistho-1_new@9953
MACIAGVQPGDEGLQRFLAHHGLGGMQDMAFAVRAQHDQAHMGGPEAALLARDDVDEVAFLQLIGDLGHQGLGQVDIVPALHRDLALDLELLAQKALAVDLLGVGGRACAGQLGGDVLDQPAVVDVPVGLGVVVARRCADHAVLVADALQHPEEFGPRGAQGHRVDVLGKDHAVALLQTEQRLRIEGLEGELAEQVQLIGLADVLARQRGHALAEIRLGQLLPGDEGADLGRLHLEQGLVQQLAHLHRGDADPAAPVQLNGRGLDGCGRLRRQLRTAGGQQAQGEHARRQEWEAHRQQA